MTKALVIQKAQLQLFYGQPWKLQHTLHIEFVRRSCHIHYIYGLCVGLIIFKLFYGERKVRCHCSCTHAAAAAVKCEIMNMH